MNAIVLKNSIKAFQMHSEYGSLFEEDYLVRTLGRIAHDPEVAITELVANAWDAGASEVKIIVPTGIENNLVVEDNGHGMSDKDFKERWMTLAYDRIKHQGIIVEFPPGRNGSKRYAYGRNGIGRHGLLCFGNSYQVNTVKEGKESIYTVGTRSQKNPFFIQSTDYIKGIGSGTRLTVKVERHLPDADRLREILTARFLHDPQFVVRVNGKTIKLEEHEGLFSQVTLRITNSLTVEAYAIDSAKSALSTIYQGVAFWVNNRLVGTPSWVVGNTSVLDGRSRFAKSFSIVIKAGDEWMSEIEADWSRFKLSNNVKELYKSVSHYSEEVFESLSSSQIEMNSEEALVKNREEFKELSTLGKLEVADFTQELVTRQPSINPETLALAVLAVINLEKSRSGTALLEKLIKLDDTDIEGLDKLLSQWTIRDALSVLDEIDHRLAVIVAIEKLCADPTTDELHTLHPLITQARWLFGAEFDSNEYASNMTLKSAAQKVFKKQALENSFINFRQRPDLIFLADSTLSIVGTESYDNGDPNLTKIEDVLIIELKKGASIIGREEMNQADGYIQDFINSGLMDGTPIIKAFVVGYEIDSKTSRYKEIKAEGDVVRGKVAAVTYGQLTRSAHKRLFKLKDKIPNRYDEVKGSDLMTRVMNKVSQTNIDLDKK